MQTYRQSTLTLDEYIRLNDVTDPFILNASDIIASLEAENLEQGTIIKQLKDFIHSFDFDTIESDLNDAAKIADSATIDILISITRIIDNYKLRTKDI